MPYPIRGNTEKGFTLVEVMVSLLAMAIGFMILWGMHFASLKMESSDQMRAEGLRLASAALDRERPGSGTFPSSNSTTSCDNATLYTAYEKARFDGCTVQVNIPRSWEMRVTVTVSWQERISMVGGGGAANKRTQSVQLSTIYIDHPSVPF